MKGQLSIKKASNVPIQTQDKVQVPTEVLKFKHKTNIQLYFVQNYG